MILVTDKKKIAEEVLTTFTREELIWFSGCIHGRLSAASATEVSGDQKPRARKITVAYGTETGNSKKLASLFGAEAKKSGMIVKVVALDQYRIDDLQKEQLMLVIMSTHGDGEPPAAARKFFDHLHKTNITLPQLKYAVLALGDTGYPLFCKAGEDVDQRFQQLGAERLAPIQKCDVDFQQDADNWFKSLLHQLTTSGENGSLPSPATKAVKQTTGKKYYEGTILSNVNLNDRGSKKQTHHIEIAAEDVDYLPGDSLGMVPENPLTVVEPILQLLGIDKEKVFRYRNEDLTAFDLLKRKLEIVYLPERVVARYAALIHQDIPSTRIGLLDLLRIYPLPDDSQLEQLIDILEPITPRLYSISSSPEAHAGEVHLTVARNKFAVNNEEKFGLCSDLLANLPEGETIQFYIHKNHQFRLPSDDKDIIMIGPGTGIAPFRAFLSHRDALGATGRNWLFFGEQHFVTDFLYQTELQTWQSSGTLSNVHLAFSRDQQEKVYVQHKMLQHGAELYEWISNGAIIYVCGAKEPMSVDVESTLVQIIQQYGNKTSEAALELTYEMKEAGRLLKDVY